MMCHIVHTSLYKNKYMKLFIQQNSGGVNLVYFNIILTCFSCNQDIADELLARQDEVNNIAQQLAALKESFPSAKVPILEKTAAELDRKYEDVCQKAQEVSDRFSGLILFQLIVIFV